MMRASHARRIATAVLTAAIGAAAWALAAPSAAHAQSAQCPDARIKAAARVLAKTEPTVRIHQIAGLAGRAEDCPGLPPVVGALPKRAALDVIVREPAPALVIEAASDAVDTTLLVEDPFGALSFNDDVGENDTNSVIRLKDVTPGAYRVYVGAYDASASGSATLTVRRSDAYDWCPDASLLPTTTLSVDDQPIRRTVRVDAPAAIEVCGLLGAIGDGAFGPRPAALILIDAAQVGRALTVAASGPDDPVLLAMTPSGQYVFNDDRTPGDDLTPELWIELSEPGPYLIWVGLYEAGADHATLEASLE